jgi:hypothetical protein
MKAARATSAMPSASRPGFRAPTEVAALAFLTMDLTPPECALAQVEGWILGVRNTRRPLTLACCDGVATGAVSLN